MTAGLFHSFDRQALYENSPVEEWDHLDLPEQMENSLFVSFGDKQFSQTGEPESCLEDWGFPQCRLTHCRSLKGFALSWTLITGTYAFCVL